MMRGDEPQCVVDVRQMMGGHVMNEGTFHGGIAQAAMQPAQKDKELRKECESYDQPVWVHSAIKSRRYEAVTQS